MRFIKIVLSLLLCVALFAGCSNTPELPDTIDIADDLKAYSADTVNWAKMDKAMISSYFGFTEENIADFSGYINDSEEHFDMIAVFKLKDVEAKSEVLKGINFMSSNVGNTFKIVNKSVYSKITSQIIAEKDDLVILCIMDNYSQVSNYLTENLGAAVIS